MEYMVDIELFHGPLDLLLYLIEHQEMDIYDIPIAVIAEQFIQHLAITADLDLEKRGSFLLMASYLLKLKSAMLLPRPFAENEEEEPDLRTELVRKLLDYKKFKQAGEFLLDLENGQIRRVYYREPDTGPELEQELSASLNGLIRAYTQLIRTLPPWEEQYLFAESDINIDTKMETIINIIGADFILFQALFAGIYDRRQVLALFLALLELIRLQRVEAYQSDPFGEIKIRLRLES